MMRIKNVKGLVIAVVGVVGVLTVGTAVVLASNFEENAKEVNVAYAESVREVDEVEETEDKEQQEAVTETKEEYNKSDRIRVECEELDFVLDFPKYLDGCIIKGEVGNSYDDYFKCDDEYVVFTGKIDKVKSYLFTMVRLHKEISKEEFEAYDQMSYYVGTYGGYTYVYSTSSEAESDEEVKLFGDYHNNEIANLKDHFEYLK